MNKIFVRENITFIAILLFLILFGGIQMTKPPFLYNTDGSIREFGIGYKNKTIFPVWLLSLVLGILCYLAVVFYLHFPGRLFGF
jgi:hypothetical protein